MRGVFLLVSPQQSDPATPRQERLKMAFTPAPGEQYTIRRKVLRIFGGAFHIYDSAGGIAGYCKQKAFRLREAMVIYTGEDQSTELLRIATQQVIDFGATYTVSLPTGEVLGQLRRKGMKSTFIRDEWLILDPTGREIGLLQEENATLALIRKWVDLASVLFPQRFALTTSDGTTIARFRQHFNLFVYRLGITIVQKDDQLDDLLVLATGCLITAIEGRQDSA